MLSLPAIPSLIQFTALRYRSDQQQFALITDRSYLDIHTALERAVRLPEADKQGRVNRARELFKLIAEGRSSREIAELSSVSVRTIEPHRFNIMGKRNLRRTADLVKHVIHKGYIQTFPHCFINPLY